MNGEVVFALRVEDFHRFLLIDEHAGVAHLTTHFGIEGRGIEHEFEVGLLLLRDLAILEDAATIFGEIPSHELRFAFVHRHPVGGFDSGGIAGALLLLLHLGVEGGFVHRQTGFGADQLREVEGETVGIEEGEGFGAVHHGLTALLRLGDHAFEQVDAGGEGAEEGFFFFANHLGDEFLLCREFGIGTTHLLHERGHEEAEEGVAATEEGVGVTHGATEDAANDVTGLRVGRQLAVGDGESNGTQVVGDDAHGHVDVFFLTVGEAGKFGDFANDGLEHISVVVRGLALHHAHQAFEAHTGVDDLVGQAFERAVGFAIVLHEHQVPNLDHKGVVLVDEFGSRNGGFLSVGAVVYVDFRAGAAGTGVAHFPEVVVLVAVDDVVLREIAFPNGGGLIVALQTGTLVAFEDGHIEVFGIDFEHFDQKLVGEDDGVFFEVVAERPVAQHFEHRVVVGVVSHLFEVVVLTAHAQAFLRVGHAAALGFDVAENDVLELVHTGVGEHQRGIVLDHHRGGGNNQVIVLFKEAFEGFAYFVCCHHRLFVFRYLARIYEYPTSCTP